MRREVEHCSNVPSRRVFILRRRQRLPVGARRWPGRVLIGAMEIDCALPTALGRIIFGQFRVPILLEREVLMKGFQWDVVCSRLMGRPRFAGGRLIAKRKKDIPAAPT